MNQDNYNQNTIYALSTCYGKSGIAIIRISGPNAVTAIKAFKFTKNIIPKKALLGTIHDPITLEIIDEIILIYFPKNNSYTGEDLVELQIHGSIAIINTLLNKLSSLNYLRMANNGEFTKKALENNKISLIKAESIIDLINAESEAQRKLAIRNYNGNLDAIYIFWKNELVKIISIVEAFIDFPDDMLDTKDIKKLDSMIIDLNNKIKTEIDGFKNSLTLMNGVNASIIGPTNAGKSTLMNILTYSDTSIISDIHGTTRDIVKNKIDVSGISVILHDTAGFRKTTDKVEKLGIDKSKKYIIKSDIILLIFDINNIPPPSFFLNIKELTKHDQKIIILINKIDLDTNYSEKIKASKKLLFDIQFQYKKIIEVSLHDKLNWDSFFSIFQESVKSFVDTENHTVISNIRHQNCLKTFSTYLENSLSINILDLKAQELRFASSEIAGLLGNIHSEEILDQIFSSFCIGK
ncbi:MAG: tRNA modification GTPase [Candidatus Midichloriaceae bacterium]|jgi:tRNA modification GTPase